MIWEKIKQRLGLASPANHYNADFYESYLNAFEKHDPSTLINDQSFVIFDTETTGLDPAKDHILSIGAVRVCHQSINISDSLSIIIMHDGIQNSNAAVIHGLVNTKDYGITPVEAIQKFMQFIGSDLLVGHHVAFDRAMINNLSLICGGGPLKNPTLDTSFLARRLDKPTDPDSLDRKEYTLDKLCQRYHVVPKARHTADGDAFITALFFLKLLHRLHQKGIRIVSQLIR
ncbi:MAG: 3'-5' exonuclease [Saprospiraceae bacterium]|nr:3'-5' exonuclease [Saprospiraceae bacterium]